MQKPPKKIYRYFYLVSLQYMHISTLNVLWKYMSSAWKFMNFHVGDWFYVVSLTRIYKQRLRRFFSGFRGFLSSSLILFVRLHSTYPTFVQTIHLSSLVIGCLANFYSDQGHPTPTDAT